MPGSSSLFRASDLVEVLVDEADGHGALADGGGHPLDRPAAHVADGEHAGLAGLQQQRPAAAALPARVGAASAPVRTKPSSSRASWSASQPVCGSAPMKTNRARAASRRRSPVRLSSTTSASSASSPTSSRTSVWSRTSTPGVALDPVDEVAGHVLPQVAAAEQRGGPARRAGPGTPPPARPSCRRRRPRPGRRGTAGPPGWVAA